MIMSLTLTASHNEHSFPVWSESDQFREAPRVITIKMNWNRAYGISCFSSTEALIDTLYEQVKFNDYVAVTDFLRTNPFLINLLLEAHDEIKNVFGPSTQMSLSLFSDFDYPDETKLYLSINSIDLQNDIDKLDQIDRNWWFHNLHKAKGKMNLDLEFV